VVCLKAPDRVFYVIYLCYDDKKTPYRMIMHIQSAKAFGTIVRQTRKKAGLTQVDLAAASGLGTRFVRELEKGKPTCQLEKALRVAMLLGIKLNADLK